MLIAQTLATSVGRNPEISTTISEILDIYKSNTVFELDGQSIDAIDLTTKNSLTIFGNAENMITPTNYRYDSNSLYFDGNTYLTISNNSKLALGIGDFTVELWVYTSAFPDSQVLVDYRPSNINGAYFCLFITNTGMPRLYVNSADRITDGVTLTKNVWNHIAVVRIGTSTRIFVNGTQSGSVFGDGTTYLISANRPMIGASGYENGSLYKFTGYINELRITTGVARYNNSFTPKSVISASDPYFSSTSLFLKNGNTIDNSITDSSTNSTTITAQSIAQGTFTPFLGDGYYSNYFDGASSYLTLTSPVNIGADDFTIELWVYPTKLPDDAWTAFVSFGAPAGGQEIRIAQNINGGGFGYLFPNNSGGSNYAGFGTLPINQWHHIVLMRNGSVVVLYRNGNYVAAVSGVSFTFAPSTNNFRIGNSLYGAQDGYYTGYISNLRITLEDEYGQIINTNGSRKPNPK